MAGRGRPEYDDAPALARMARLRVSGKEKFERAAARASAHLTNGASPKAIEDRLRRKYARHRETLEQYAREKLAAAASAPAPGLLAEAARTPRSFQDFKAEGFGDISPRTLAEAAEEHSISRMLREVANEARFGSAEATITEMVRELLGNRSWD